MKTGGGPGFTLHSAGLFYMKNLRVGCLVGQPCSSEWPCIPDSKNRTWWDIKKKKRDMKFGVGEG